MKAALTFGIVCALCLLAPPVVHCQDPPAIDITPLNPVTVEGGSILFSCTYVGELVEVPSLLRFIDGMFQNINDQTILTPNATTRIVTFQLDNLTNAADNGALFTCSLFQDFSVTVKLEVQIPVRYELAPNSTQQLIEGADEIIDLVIVAFPDPTIFTWYFNGAVITSDGTVTLTAGNITFTPLSRTNAGTYMVRSENPAGNASVSFTLEVQSDCGVPQAPASGSIARYSGRGVGAVISFQCDCGFSPSEEVTATCVRDEDTGSGTWTPDPAEHSCRSFIGGSKFELSIGSAVAIATVLCSVVFFILGTVFGILIHYCITTKRAQYSVNSSSTEPQTPAPVYEDVTATDAHPKAIKLSENIAYGPARQ